MNLERVRRRHPGLDCCRIDIVIGRKAFWGRGFGAETVRLLTAIALEDQNAEAVFACDVADYNERSLRLFHKLGFEIDSAIPQPDGGKARRVFDFILTREMYTVSSA